MLRITAESKECSRLAMAIKINVFDRSCRTSSLPLGSIGSADEFLASSPGPSQILSRSRGDKIWEGPGDEANEFQCLRLRTGLVPRPLQILSPRLRDKIWGGGGGAGDKANSAPQIRLYVFTPRPGIHKNPA